MSAEAELRAAAADLRRATESLDSRYGDILARLTEVLKRLETPGQRAAKQSTPATQITDQPTHSGQLPSKSNRTEGEPPPPDAGEFGKSKPSQRIPGLRYRVSSRRPTRLTP